MAKRILTRVREAIYNEFGKYIPGKTKADKMSVIRNNTYTGKNDPGGWSRGAAVIIHTEGSGIPNPTWDESPGSQIIEGWFRVSKELGDHFCETYNSAVMTVYKS